MTLGLSVAFCYGTQAVGLAAPVYPLLHDLGPTGRRRTWAAAPLRSVPKGRLAGSQRPISAFGRAAGYGSILLIVIGPAARARRIKTASEESPSRRRS